MNARLMVWGSGLLFCLAMILSMGCDDDKAAEPIGSNPSQYNCHFYGNVIVKSTGQPAPNIYVKLLTENPAALYADQFTDANGYYSFANVPQNRYSVVFDSQIYDQFSTVVTLNTSEFVLNVQLFERYPQILEAHGSVEFPSGVGHYTFYDVRVTDAVGISTVQALMNDNVGEHPTYVDLTDTDLDGDLEGEFWNWDAINFTYSFAIRVTDTDGNVTEEFYTFE